MKIKIFALALALLLCALPFVSCTAPVDSSSAYEVYNYASTLLNNTLRYEKHITMTLTQGEEGNEEKMVSTSVVKSSDSDFSLDIGVGFYAAGATSPEQTMELNFVYKNGTLYYAAPAGKYFGECDEDTLSSFVIATATIFYPFKSNLPAFTKDDLKGVQVVENADGTRSITMAVRGDKLNYLTDTFQATSENIVFKNATVSIIFSKDNAPLHFSTTFDSYVDDVAAGTFQFEIDYINPGSSPSISAPSDTSEYVQTDFKALVDGDS